MTDGEISGIEINLTIIQGRNLVAKDRNVFYQKTTSDVRKDRFFEFMAQFYSTISMYKFMFLLNNIIIAFQLLMSLLLLILSIFIAICTIMD
jgi:hypothetical protein